MDRLLAILRLRFTLFRRTQRGAAGAVNILGGIVATLLGLVVAFVMAVGFGVLMHLMVRTGDITGIRVSWITVFYTFFFFGVILPLLTGGLDSGSDVTPLRVFPLRAGQLFALQLAAAFGGSGHLVYYPALTVVLVTGVLRPGFSAPAGVALAVLALSSFVIWSNVLALVLSGVMRNRRAREIILLVAFVGLIVVSLAPVMIESKAEELGREEVESFTVALKSVLSPALWLPPAVAAKGMTALATDRGADAWWSMLGLVGWNLAGLVLGYRVFRRFHLDAETVRSGRGLRTRRRESSQGLLSFDSWLASWLPDELRAVAAKDLRYLFRSVYGKLNLVLLPFFVFVVAFLLRDSFSESLLGVDLADALLFGMLLYALIFSNSFVNNSLAYEADGIQSYFTSPVSARGVIAGKNLALWLYNVLFFAICLVAWSILIAPPKPITLLSALLFYAFGMLTYTTCGNLVSILFPVPRDPSSINNSPAQTAMLLGLATIAGISVLTSLGVLVPTVLGIAWLRPVILAVLLAIAIGVYWLVLRVAAQLLLRRKERIIETLRSTG